MARVGFEDRRKRLDLTGRQRHRQEPAAPPPEKIAENIQSIFLVNGSFFAITKEDVLLYWDTYEYGEPETIAQDVESVSSLSLRGGTIYQYLSRQGEVYTIQTRPEMKAAENPIAGNVIALCEDDFIRADHSLWTWQGTAANGGPAKNRSGVWAAANPKFYVDWLGRLHWRTSTFRLEVPSQTVRWLNPDARKAEAAVLCLLLLLLGLYKLFK